MNAERRGADPDHSELRAAFGRFPSGIAAIGAVVDGRQEGLVATSFSVGVSFDPPLVLFSVQHASTTWPRLRTAPRLGVSVLGVEHAGIARQLASRTGDRFAGVDVQVTASGAILIGGSAMWMQCTVQGETPAGDHSIVTLRVEDLRIDPAVDPLVYHASRFRRLAS